MQEENTAFASMSQSSGLDCQDRSISTPAASVKLFDSAATSVPKIHPMNCHRLFLVAKGGLGLSLYIFSREDIQRLVQAASESGYHTLRQKTYSTLFALLACSGLRVSEAIRLHYDDITPDGLVIRCSKFRKSRLVPLHETVQAGIERYLEHRLPYAPFDDHVFVSLRRKPLRTADVETAFQSAVGKIGLQRGPGLPDPTPHSLRHTFAVRALETCPDGRDHITKHMVTLSTYLGHAKVSHTYWYLEAVPELMRSIAERCESFCTGGRL